MEPPLCFRYSFRKITYKIIADSFGLFSFKVLGIQFLLKIKFLVQITLSLFLSCPLSNPKPPHYNSMQHDKNNIPNIFITSFIFSLPNSLLLSIINILIILFHSPSYSPFCNSPHAPISHLQNFSCFFIFYIKKSPWIIHELFSFFISKILR